jgi:hypothetical protein
MADENQKDDNQKDESLDRGDTVAQAAADKKGEGADPGKGGAKDTKADKDGEAAAGDKLSRANENESEETPEERAEREAEEAKRRIRIPKARFDEAQAKARAREAALLEQIEKLKAGQQSTLTQQALKQAQAQIDSLQDKYEDLILDGKKEEARQVRRHLDAMRSELVEYQTSVKADSARRQAIDELTYSSQLAGIEAKYPELNPDHEDFDEAKTDEVATLLDAFVKAGTPRAEALARAVKYVAGSPREATDNASAARKTAEQIAAERAAQARERNNEANKRQPANMSKVGLNSDQAGKKAGDLNVDVMKMSQAQFAKFAQDEEAMAAARGDTI